VLGRLRRKAAASRPWRLGMINGPWPRGRGPIWSSQPARPTFACAWSPGPWPARVPPVDWWPRVAAAAAQARGGLGESVGQHFEDGDSPGQCGGGGPKQWHLSAAEALRWSPAEEKRLMRLATRRGFLKNRERSERVIGASKSTKNPHGCTVHHGGGKV
jgi:hypothetical protein